MALAIYLGEGYLSCISCLIVRICLTSNDFVSPFVSLIRLRALLPCPRSQASPTQTWLVLSCAAYVLGEVDQLQGGLRSCGFCGDDRPQRRCIPL